MLKRWRRALLRSEPVQAAIVWLLGGFLHLALRTTRWAVHGRLPQRGPAIFATWHEHLPLMPALWRAAVSETDLRGIVVLASRHRDGQLLGRVMRRFGPVVVTGSSGVGKGGAAALRQLLRTLRDGGAVGVTPDGPRGPRRVAAPGVAQLAALSGVPVTPVAAQARRAYRLGSWDRMALPVPFDRGVVVCGPPVLIGRDEGGEAGRRRIEAALNGVADRAAALCR